MLWTWGHGQHLREGQDVQGEDLDNGVELEGGVGALQPETVHLAQQEVKLVFK